ncbi:MAG TPA: GNAT family N-acetyltransferase [Humisphaera sp.]
MSLSSDPITVTNDRTAADFDAVETMLRTSYWAAARSRADIEAAFAAPGSIGFYALDADGRTVGCARVVTDGVTIAWVCDVIVAEAARGRGVGKRLVRAIVDHPALRGPGLRMVLGTRDAQGLYEQFGFFRRELMWRHPGGAEEPVGF